MTYNPPTKVTTRQIPYLAMVTQYDPDFERRKHYELEYEFEHKRFFADPYQRGAYNVHSNVYPVGQPFGGNDATVVANKPLMAGIPTGGWA